MDLEFRKSLEGRIEGLNRLRAGRSGRCGDQVIWKVTFGAGLPQRRFHLMSLLANKSPVIQHFLHRIENIAARHERPEIPCRLDENNLRKEDRSAGRLRHHQFTPHHCQLGGRRPPAGVAKESLCPRPSFAGPDSLVFLMSSRITATRHPLLREAAAREAVRRNALRRAAVRCSAWACPGF